MKSVRPLLLHNGRAAPLSSLPVTDLESLRAFVAERVREGGWLLSLHGMPRGDSLLLVACIGAPDLGMLELVAAPLPDRYAAFTPDCAAAHLFEREIAEQWGVVPEGHPWLHPVRFHDSARPGKDAWERAPGRASIGERPFFAVEGDEVHEVAVGPVHAGVIEPGHFRFQCHGETVFHLEISLGYQHRGAERSLIGGPHARGLAIAETVAGDTTVGHATAYCQVIEGLAEVTPPPRAEAIRALALELERMANHTGDLGALSGDVAYLPTASFCGRLRGDLLNLTAALCGSRFGRGIVRPGGVGFDLDPSEADSLRQRLDAIMTDVESAVKLLWDSPSALGRLEGMGLVSRDIALELGLVGPCARACGLERDVRADFPAGHYRFAQVPVSTWDTGDVFARAFVRWLELQRSADFVREVLADLPQGPTRATIGPLAPDQIAVSVTEGWRGAICHVASTDDQGRFLHYKIVDPSFHDWMGLAMALRNVPVSEFPLCNKSFNLSYCGHDL